MIYKKCILNLVYTSSNKKKNINFLFKFFICLKLFKTDLKN